MYIAHLLGIHFLAGALKAGHRNTEELWNEQDGIPLIRACMSFKRFKQIKKHLRFDDKLRRDKNDPLAPVRSMVNQFNFDINKIYRPGPFICVDEMLLEFHGRVRFRQYIPTKPGKFGIKIYWSVDAENSYPLQCLVYIGEKSLSLEEKEESSSISEATVRKIVRPYLGQGRCVTGDNYFTSLNLCHFLMKEKTTYVGTIRNNRREIPPVAKCTDGRQRGDTRHFFCDNTSLCSFWDKGKKPVLLLSSMHSRNLSNLTMSKSDVVLFYNSTKAGVDNLDKMVRSFRSQRKCYRWPYGVFFTLADCAIIATLVMFRELKDANSTHYNFKRQLAYQLCLPYVKKRAEIPRLRGSVLKAMELLGVQPQPKEYPPSGQIVSQKKKKSRCEFCPRKADKKVFSTCVKCSKFVCEMHKYVLCSNCS